MKSKAYSLPTFLALLSPKGILPVWLMLVLSPYFFVLLVATHIVGLRHNAADLLSKESWEIIVPCALLVEFINQTTYILAKKKPRTASRFKCVAFCLVFTSGIVAYNYLVFSLPVTNMTWRWNEITETVAHILVYVVLSWAFPIYSVCTDVRFLFLYGKFQLSSKS